MSRLNERVADAIRFFWASREKQKEMQGAITGKRDYGSRGAVTGAKQMDGFISLVCELLMESGLPQDTIFYTKAKVVLPGFFRATKEWDLLAVANGHLLASVEFKSQVGPSFGNNFNNRTEEALGSATDLWTAYREGAFVESPRPWLGYLMLLEKAEGSLTPVDVKEPHFRVFDEFRGASYAKRYELLCRRLVRERLYDAACLMLSDSEGGRGGKYAEPARDLRFQTFAASLRGHASAFADTLDG